MPDQTYPQGFVLNLLNSEHVTPQTADALKKRWHTTHRSVLFFTAEEFRLLDAVCDCLYPQEEGYDKIPLAVLLEENMANGAGKGWRYDKLPPVKEMFRQGLKGIDEEAQEVFKKSFIELSADERNTVLQAVQEGNVKTTAWKNLSAQLFFTELLVAATEQHYSHPLAKDVIGDVSFADLPNWQRITLNGNDGREPFNTPADAKP